MYKTIRHGENSLQYTILPQNDDFRLDGNKISGTGGGGNGCGHKMKRGKRRSFFAYLGLIFVCTVIIGAILIPFLVSAECLPNPSDWFKKAKVALASRHDNFISNIMMNGDDERGGYNGNKSNNHNHNNNNNNNNSSSNNNNNKNNNKTESTIQKAYLDSNQQNVVSESDIKNSNINNNNNNQNDNDNENSISVTTVKEDTIDSVSDNIFPTSNSRKKVLNSQHFNLLPTEGIALSNQNDDNDRITNNAATTMKNIKTTSNTITSTTTKIIVAPITQTQKIDVIQKQNNNDDTTDESERNFLSMTMTTILASITPSSGSNLLKQQQSQSITKIPSLSSLSTKKPIILPVLAKTNSVVRENGNFIETHDESKNWIRTHWPFIDPSSYFQWMGYKTEDSVLLPAILGIALIGMVLIMILCVIVRHKNRIDSIVRKRNRNNTGDGGEDNTTLLTTGNTSDDD